MLKNVIVRVEFGQDFGTHCFRTEFAPRGDPSRIFARQAVHNDLTANHTADPREDRHP